MLFITTTIIFTLASFLFFIKWKKASLELEKQQFGNIHFQDEIANLKKEIQLQNQKIESQIIYNNDLQNLKGKFEGSFNSAREELTNVRREK